MTIKKRPGTAALAVATAVIGSVLFTSAYAGDCLQVKPHIKNDSGKEIKVRDLIYKRNGKLYKEGLTNTKVAAGHKAKYGGQRLNHLDSGQKAFFGVQFRVRRDSDNDWVNIIALKPNNEKCWDGKVVNIKVSESDIAKARR